jgi:hypothetical protein
MARLVQDAQLGPDGLMEAPSANRKLHRSSVRFKAQTSARTVSGNYRCDRLDSILLKSQCDSPRPHATAHAKDSRATEYDPHRDNASFRLQCPHLEVSHLYAVYRTLGPDAAICS